MSLSMRWKRKGGAGLEKKIAGMDAELRTGCDSEQAYLDIGLDKSDYRSYSIAAAVLRDINIAGRIRLLSLNPEKRRALEQAGFIVVVNTT